MATSPSKRLRRILARRLETPTMWETIKDAIKSNGGTVRFLVILAALVIAAVVIGHALGSSATGVFGPGFPG
jgi:hypothetical protein